MFLVIVAAAFHAKSSALLADSLDNLGDALTYGLSIYAVSRGAVIKAKVALFKGILIFLAALMIAAQIAYRLFVPSVPVFEVMGLPNHCINLPVGAASWPRIAPGTALLQDVSEPHQR
mgnify:CR=1 FL=1